jgi:beta-aspartyl-dipeptidase (metallo-type)
VILLLENADVFAPEPRGRCDVLVLDARIAQVGDVDRDAVRALGRDIDLEIIDAGGRILVPGIVDVHEHLTGGSGEEGWASRTPALQWSELVSAGITTVVGTLGVDTTTRTMADLHAQGLTMQDEGLTAYLWTGGYQIPPMTLCGGVREDIMFTPHIIGVGEVAIADARTLEPTPRELARLVVDAQVAGRLARKAGITHLHVGEGKRGLALLRELLEDETLQVEPAWLYPTHVQRGERLMCEALELSRQGMTVDLDVAERDLGKWLRFWRDEGGDFGSLTASSDADGSAPAVLFEQLRACVHEHDLPLEEVLPLVTSNPARVLQLEAKGRVAVGADADLLLLEPGSLALDRCIARGVTVVEDGRPVRPERFVPESSRQVEIHGGK